MGNQEMLDKINSALKAITTNDLKDSKLTPAKQNQFVKTVSQATSLLDAARRIDMNSHTHDIDRVGFADRILGKAKEGQNSVSERQPDFHTNTLESVEVMAVAGITDSTLEDNIEQEGFEDTLLDLIADRSGIDLEELYLLGDTNSNDSYLALTDGWLKKSANEVDGSAGDFKQSDVEAMFDAMIAAVPKKYFRDRNEWTIWAHWDVEDEYRNLVRERGTGLGDTAQTSNEGLAYKGFKVRHSANMPQGQAFMAPANNLVYGIYRDIRIEPDRQPKARKTDFVASLRVDANYEDENASVVGKGFDPSAGSGSGSDGSK